MSLRRCANGKNAISSASALTDHIWVSDDLLTSTFRRFVVNQRRYGSHVPGPLEARRRLDKRRNTAMASVIGAGPMDDVACLFGLNGSEHMKQKDKGLGLWRKSWQAPPAPASSFGDNTEALDRHHEQAPSEEVTQNQVEKRIEDCWTTSELEDAVRELKLDLRQEPRYSRMLFDHLQAGVDTRMTTIDLLVSFLDNPHLNLQGSGNYLEAVTHHLPTELNMKSDDTRLVFRALLRGLQLGRINSQELKSLIRVLGEFETKLRKLGVGPAPMVRLLRKMWTSIRKCPIYGPQDVDKTVIDTWLGYRSKQQFHGDIPLVRRILTDSNPDVDRPQWLSKFVLRWIRGWHDPKFELNAGAVVKLLRSFDPIIIADTMNHVARALVDSQETHALVALPGFFPPDLIASSIGELTRTWISTHDPHMLAIFLVQLGDRRTTVIACTTTRLLSASEDATSLDTWRSYLHQLRENNKQQLASLLADERYQDEDMQDRRAMIMERLWILQAMRGIRAARNDYESAFDPLYEPTKVLYKAYEAQRVDLHKDLWNSLMHSIHDLRLPLQPGLMVKDLRQKIKNNAATRRLGQHGVSEYRTYSELFADRTSYDKIGRHGCFQNVEEVIRQIDFTSPDFLDNALEIARTGDSPSVMNLVRLFRAHIPFKIALAFSRPQYRVSVDNDKPHNLTRFPDPQAALETVNAIVVAIACSTVLSPRRAFEYVQWFYRWLLRHGAPINPPIARALYHTGVVRMRAEGRRVGLDQYQYIMERVELVEEPEIVDALRQENRRFEGVPSVQERRADFANQKAWEGEKQDLEATLRLKQHEAQAAWESGEWKMNKHDFTEWQNRTWQAEIRAALQRWEQVKTEAEKEIGWYEPKKLGALGPPSARWRRARKLRNKILASQGGTAPSYAGPGLMKAQDWSDSKFDEFANF